MYIRRLLVSKILKKIFSLNLYNGNPLRYREQQFTLAELERRLNAEVNGFKN